ncbi:MAG: threonylcarbamoyl-AMP synthase [Candidatus Latescibacterota bacterium]|nr:MAG: threonylcarbamoyl-AMP synthase [Candidatus Latescibacterota bacterium]
MTRRIPSDHRNVTAVLSDTLSRDGVVIVPTDTIYGLSARLSSESGYRRILDIKHCEPGRRFLYLAGSVEMVDAYIASWGCASKQLLASIWPAPLTAIFYAGTKCADWVGDSVAFRIPESELLVQTINDLGEPIVSTSVNRAGEPPVNDVESIETSFGELVDLVVAADAPPEERPSTIVDFTGEKPVVVRRGVYLWPGGGNPSN